MATLLEGTPYTGIIPDDAKMLIHREGESSAESVNAHNFKSTVRIGDIITSYNTLPPNDTWLACDGSSVAEASYPDLATLFSVVGGFFDLPTISNTYIKAKY